MHAGMGKVHVLAAGLAPILVATLGPEAAAVCAAHAAAGATCVDVSAALAAEEAECATRAQQWLKPQLLVAALASSPSVLPTLASQRKTARLKPGEK